MDQGVIRRKLAGAQVAPEAGGGAEKAWPLALARAARGQLDLAVEAGPVRAERLSLTELLDLPPERALIALLEGPREALGVLVLSAEVLASLIEAQTLGRVLSQPVVARKPTRTDAAMVADLIDAALEELQQALLAEEDLVWTDGFRYSSVLDGARPLALMLEDAAFKVLRCECELGGARKGGLILALPAEGHGRRPHRAAPLPGPDPAQEEQFSAALAQEVMEAEAELIAVLGRVRLPLSGALALRVGDLLPLTGAALDGVELTGRDGRGLAQGKLGQQRGMRALRLTETQGARGAGAAVTVPQRPAEPPLPLPRAASA